MAAADKDMQAAIAATRFGMGARPGEIESIRADPKGWLKDQVRAEGADQPHGPDGPLPSMQASFAVYTDYQAKIRPIRQEVKAQAQPAAQTTTSPQMGAQPQMAAAATDLQEQRRLALLPIRQEVGAEILARTQLAATTQDGFRERWTLFWINHFTVADKSVPASTAVGPFEREAVRPHVFGRFEAMLNAATRHPGMLIYLDQAQSVGPQSPAGKKRNGGLNENLAREILELHTVGVDAGYTQADVTEFARALTGWSVGGANAGPDMGAYIYRAALHEPGERRLMGRGYRDGQEDQAAAILADLAVHPATARHLAHKLAAHFVADDPPPALVARLTKAWSHSSGDLAVVAQALIDAPEAWAPAASKLKTPYEFLVSSYRAADAVPKQIAQEVMNPLTTLGQRPFTAPQPNGWSDQASDWAAPDALVKRLTWARGFAQRFAPMGAPQDTAKAALGERLSPRTAMAVSRAESRPEAFALLLMSPEFQRR